jgi:hypothetical protein
MQTNHYLCYGMAVHSRIPLPLSALDSTATVADVDVDYAVLPAVDLPQVTPWLHASSTHLRLQRAELGCMQVQAQQVSLDTQLHSTSLLQQLYIVGWGLAGAAMLQQRLVLHANALEKDGSVILIAGDSGQGKSTLSAQLLASGYRLHSEDVAVFADSAAVWRGMQSLLLQPEAAVQWPFVVLEKGDRQLLQVPQSQQVCYPVKALICVSFAEVTAVTELKGMAKFALLRRQCYRPFLSQALGIANQQAKLLAQHFATIPVWHYQRPRHQADVFALSEEIAALRLQYGLAWL